MTLTRRIRSFALREKGAVLVEFAIVFPMVALFFVFMVEMGRTFWSYQQVVAGVRDATRYLARVAPVDVCDEEDDLSGYTEKLSTIVQSEPGLTAILPTTVTVDSVTPRLDCIEGDFRTNPAPIATVTAAVTINMPFASAFRWYGAMPAAISASVSEQARIFGQ